MLPGLSGTGTIPDMLEEMSLTKTDSKSHHRDVLMGVADNPFGRQLVS